MTANRLEEMVEEVIDEIIHWRRHLHEYPELSFQEHKTSEFVYSLLASFGNMELSRPTKTSVLARLVGSKPGKVLAIRADMDALPIQEDTGLPFTSKVKGVMHACGHDGHTAMLLGAAKILSNLQEEIHGEIRFIFQHAEELFPGGAQEMVKAEVMNDVDAVIGIHLSSLLPSGIFSTTSGPATSNADTFDLTITGKGGHASRPHQCIDPVSIAAQLINGINQFVSKKVDPADKAVISITKIKGSDAHNIIPESVTMGGSVRTFNPNLRDQIPKWIEQYARGLTIANDCSFSLDYVKGYNSIVNDGQITSFAQETVIDLFGQDSFETAKPSMGSEDFSAFSDVADGCFVFLGASVEGETYPHHHERFVFDEGVLKLGVLYFLAMATRFNSL